MGTPAKQTPPRHQPDPEVGAEFGKDKAKQAVKIKRFNELIAQTDIINFKGATLIREATGYYGPLTSDRFARLAYEVHGGPSIQNIREWEHMARATAPDRTDSSHLICFGERVWNMRTLNWDQTADPNRCVYASQVEPSDDTQAAFQYVLELAHGDEDLAWDMLQGLAPLFMENKPAGVIWFVGDGANGKSSLINAVYKVIGHHLTSLTVAVIEDGRATPTLNGKLGNVCRESSEGRVEDTEKYKAIGTHEPFFERKFHSQDMVQINGDLHHIFNANNIPTFADKTRGARRRTLIVPFTNVFKDDPLFEQRTFTPQFLGGLLALILEATHIIRDNNSQYRFSVATKEAKSDYDSEVNSAEAFLEHLREHKVEAFSNYRMLKLAYENFCANEGLTVLGVQNLKRVMKTAKAERRSVKLENASPTKWYFIDESQATATELTSLDGVGLHVRLEHKDLMEPIKDQMELSDIGRNWL